MPPKLGIIAGGGAMPGQLIDACRQEGRDFFILGIEGAAHEAPFADVPHAFVPVGAIGTALALLKKAEVEEIVLAGHIKRPPMSKLGLDATGTRLMAKLGLKLFGGDDALLKEIVRFLESEGFRVVGTQSIGQGLLAPEGVYTAMQPDARAEEDIALGFQAARAVGALDIGQAVVVESGYVLGVEAAEGTDALIERCASLMREQKRAVLVKACKPGQDARADLPSIGEQTVQKAHAAGCLGIAVEAGKAVLINRDALVRLADQYGLFVTGIT
ncbi:MAG: UDP-2,3-diacylglucosamine diphosphatase LpxI [Alphaproteobacteria bacterium]|nr:UDP-2,3-diacylglucosamine diphosphatase LpxI [Alphaproteobacteria bacterium]